MRVKVFRDLYILDEKESPRARVSPDAKIHILDGDRQGGGHRHGTGQPGKSEFPPDWSDDKIIR
jgi:hypothetical protein